MNCEKTRQWISRELDGELSPRRSWRGALATSRAARLKTHLDSCPACRKIRDEWASLGDQLRERQIPGMQTPEAAWMGVRRAIHNAQTEGENVGNPWVLGAPLRWVAATLLIMIAGSGLFLALQKKPVAVARMNMTEVEFVETGLPDATPMVYEDAESGCTVIWIVEANGKERGRAGT